MVYQAALSSYRNAIRAIRIAFVKDKRMTDAAKTQIKQGFVNNKQLSGPRAEQEIKKMNDISTILIRNVVQGEYSSEGKYKLNIHAKTELGDNSTIKRNRNLGSLTKLTEEKKKH